MLGSETLKDDYVANISTDTPHWPRHHDFGGKLIVSVRLSNVR